MSEQELPSYPPDRSDLAWFQFSLAGLFILMTVVAIILSIFVTVGQLFGMSTHDVLTQGLSRFLLVGPRFLIWCVGLAVAVRRLRRNRTPAILTIVALAGLIAISIASQVAQMVLVFAASAQRISIQVVSWSLTGIGAIALLVDTACWILVLVAIFRHRPPDTMETLQGN